MDKNRELIHLEHFREICIFFPDGEIDKKKRDKPDFIVHATDKLLGIEHTEIFQPEPTSGVSLQALDQMAQRVVKQASDLYIQDHNKPIYVQIMFRQGKFIKKQCVDHLAEIVFRIIARTPLTPGTTITLRRKRVNFKYFPAEIAMIRIYWHPNIKENNWFCSSPGSIPELTAADFQEKIDRKEPKVDEYRSNCSELWLLIVADDFRNPSTLDISADAAIHHYHTKFDRVFIFWNATRHYIELQLTGGDKST